MAIISEDFEATGQLLIVYSAFFRKEWKYNEKVHQIFIDYKKSYDSFRRRILYNILIELVWYHHETGKTKKNVSEGNLKHRPGKQACV